MEMLIVTTTPGFEVSKIVEKETTHNVGKSTCFSLLFLMMFLIGNLFPSPISAAMDTTFISIDKLRSEKIVSVMGRKSACNEKRVLHLLDDIALTSIQNQVLFKRMSGIIEKIMRNEIVIVTVFDTLPLENPLADSSKFFINLDLSLDYKMGPKTPVIILDHSYFELLKKHRSLGLSLLVHEMASASFYFENPESYRDSFENPMENYLYAMDAFSVQADFIECCSKKKNASLTQYEKLIMLSNKEDNLDTVSKMILGRDMKLTYFLTSFADNGDALDDSVKAFLDVGRQVIDYYDPKIGVDEYDKYCSIVPLYTFLQLGPELLADIHRKKGLVMKTIVLEEHPEFMSLFNEGAEKFMQNEKRFIYKEQFAKRLTEDL